VFNRISRGAVAALVLAGATVAGGVPVIAADREHRVMMAELRMLQEQNQQLHQTLITLAETLKALNAKLDEQSAATRKTFADQRLVIENLGEGVRIIRERVDETNVRIATLSQDIEVIRTMAANAVPPAAPPTGEPGAAPPPTDPNAPQQTGTSPSQLYSLAFSDYTGGQWDLAIQGFQTYLKAYPKSPLAHQAALYIGQAHYAAGRFKEAIAAYNEVIANYEGTESVPEAYYKRGLAYERLGDRAQARESLEFVLKNFPEVSIAYLAKQALERLTRQD
jgi:tol-pal system protein YbgF